MIKYNNTDKLTIQEVLNNNECISCRLCNVICPEKAIAWIEDGNDARPEISEEKCTVCGLCYKLCPSRTLGKELKKPTAKGVKILSVYAKDFKSRMNATSGGFYRTLASKLLTIGVYDFATYAVYKKNYSYAEIQISDSPSDILQSSKSIYLPVQLDLLLEFMIKNKDKRIIIVGTACTIHAVLNFVDQYNLERKNYLLVGLFCNAVMNNGIIKYFKKKTVSNASIIGMDFRSKEKTGWPGDVKIELDDGKNLFIPRRERIAVKEDFYLNRCISCPDKYNVKADISIGDDYRDMKNILGTNIIIMRTKLGENAFNNIADKVDYDLISDTGVLKAKAIRRKSGHNTKQYSYSPLSNYKYFIIAATLELFKRREKRDRKNKTDILIIGASKKNDGAYMMYKTTSELIKKYFPDKRIITNPITRDETCENNIKSDPNIYYREIKNLLNPFGAKTTLLREEMERIFLVIDISGYVLRGNLDIKYNLRYLFKLLLFIMKDIPVILMPQTIGPFDPGVFEWKIIKIINKIYSRKLSRVFLREKQSAKYAKEIGLKCNKIYSDIVFRNKELKSIQCRNTEDYVLLIPSVKAMINAGLKKYIEMIESACAILKENNLDVKIITSADEDLELAVLLSHITGKEICSNIHLGKKLELIGSSQFIITSRYHPAVFSLSLGTPVIIIGWSHKYKELMKLFKQEGYYINSSDNLIKEKTKEAVTRMIAGKNNHAREIASIIDGHIKKESEQFLDKLSIFYSSLK